MRSLLCLLLLALVAISIEARPLVRHISSTHEFERLLKKHATETGLPVIADFYSDGCGPCRMIAPVFKKLAQEIGQDKAVFVKVDTNTLYQLSSQYQVRSLPTFIFFLHGKKWDQFSGAGEAQLRQMTEQVVRQAEIDNVELSLDNLKAYYQEVEPSKEAGDIEAIYKKCADMVKGTDTCIGAAANQLSRRLKKKYKQKPQMHTRFSSEARQPGYKKKDDPKTEKPKTSSSSSGGTTSSPTANEPNLHLASKEQLMAEIERRLEAEREEQVEKEEDDDAESEHSWTPGNFPEKVVIVGGGPAGMSAAIYAARAGLDPVVIAPPMGGQLQGKGVDVENYPGLANMTGPGVIASMRSQAASFGAVFETDTVVGVNASGRPLKVMTNSTTIETHSIIVATGAESKWLDIPGEYELRGGGVSSCATCDGAIFRGRDVVVVGGGDAAMEDALVLARTSGKVTLVHRRDTFRASKVLAQRVIDHPSIHILYNTVVVEILGQVVTSGNEEEDVNLDDQVKVVKAAKIQNVLTGEATEIKTDAVFVAIGHTPTTQFLAGVVEFDEDHPGYVQTVGQSTKTSVPGIFAAGDVSDAIYRQAITSAGSGAAAALDAERYLSEEGLGNEAAEFEAELMAELLETEEPRLAYNAYAETGGRVDGMKESIAGEL